MTLRHSVIQLILAAALFALAGCAARNQPTTEGSGVVPPASSSPSPTVGDGTPIPLKVSVAPYLSYAPFYIAAKEGYFTEQGLDVELVRLARSSDAVPALAQGQLDVASFPVSTALLNAMVRDSGIKIVASKDQSLDEGCVFSGFVARTGSAILGADEVTRDMLEKMNYDVIPTSMSGYILDTLLQRYGLSVDEINVVDMPNAAATLDAMLQGTVDVATMTEPWITQARAAGAGDVWLGRGEISPRNQLAVVAYGPTILKSNPNAGERFMVAYLKGVRDFAEGMTEPTLALLEKELELDRTLLTELCLPHIPLDGAINDQSIVAFGDWAAARDLIDAPVSAEVFWEPRFVEYARQKLGDP